MRALYSCVAKAFNLDEIAAHSKQGRSLVALVRSGFLALLGDAVIHRLDALAWIEMMQTAGTQHGAWRL